MPLSFIVHSGSRSVLGTLYQVPYLFYNGIFIEFCYMKIGEVTQFHLCGLPVNFFLYPVFPYPWKNIYVEKHCSTVCSGTIPSNYPVVTTYKLLKLTFKVHCMDWFFRIFLLFRLSSASVQILNGANTVLKQLLIFFFLFNRRTRGDGPINWRPLRLSRGISWRVPQRWRKTLRSREPVPRDFPRAVPRVVSRDYVAGRWWHMLRRCCQSSTAGNL